MGARKIDPLERQAALLLYLLTESGPRTRDQIAAHVPGYPPETASMRRQFERDKAALLDNDVPLRVNEANSTYEIKESEYYLPDLTLTDDEALALEFALSAVRIGGAPAGDLLRKVGVDLDSGIPAAGALPDEKLLPELFEARRDRSQITFCYRGGNETRTLDPYLVFFNNGFWYVVGHDHLRDEQRVFRVDRIEGDVKRSAPGAFEMPPTLRASDVLPSPWELPGDPPVIAEVRVEPALGVFVADSLGDKAERVVGDDGWVTIKFEVRNRGAFRSWLFGMLDDAEVLGPPELRAEVVDWLEAMAAS